MIEFDKEAWKRINRCIRVSKDAWDPSKRGLSDVNLKRLERAVDALQTKWEWNEVERQMLQDPVYRDITFETKSPEKRTGVANLDSMPPAIAVEKLVEYADALGRSLRALVEIGKLDDAALVQEVLIYTQAAIPYLESPERVELFNSSG